MLRRVASRLSARATRFARVQVQHDLGPAELARSHAARRNAYVVAVLTYLATLKSSMDLAPQRLREHRARWQDVRARQPGELVNTVDMSNAIEVDFADSLPATRGYGTWEAAHCLPCSLDYDNVDLSELASCPRERELLRAPFADVSILPAIYNDADQRAEDAGLRRTLERCARQVLARQRHESGVDATLIRYIYRHEWMGGAFAAYGQSCEDIRKLGLPERARRRQLESRRFTGFTSEDMTRDCDAVFYDSMSEILALYAEQTRRVMPLELNAHAIATLVEEFESASATPSRRRMRYRLVGE